MRCILRGPLDNALWGITRETTGLRFNSRWVYVGIPTTVPHWMIEEEIERR